MTDDTERPPRAALWLDEMVRRAYPETAGITLAAVEALADLESFAPAQVAYLMSVMFDLGAQARTAGDLAELAASRAAAFVPEPTRAARIAIRTAQMAEQAELYFLRRRGGAPAGWPGGTPEEALAAYGWDADRPEPDHGPSAARWHPGVGVPTRRTRSGLVWADQR